MRSGPRSTVTVADGPAGVLDDVRQCLLDEPVDDRLDVPVGAGLVAFEAERDRHARLFLERSRQPPQRRAEAQIVQHGRPEHARELTHLGEARLGQLPGGRGVARQRPVPLGDPLLEQDELDAQRGQRLADAVVEVAGDARPFFLLKSQHPP